MTKNELIKELTAKHKRYTRKDVALVVQTIVDSMTEAMKRCERIEIRGFGTFSIRERISRKARNPKSGEKVMLDDRKVPFFRTAKDLRLKVDKNNEL